MRLRRPMDALAWREGSMAGIDPLLPFEISPATGGEHQKATVAATGGMRQSTKSLRSSRLSRQGLTESRQVCAACGACGEPGP